MGEFNANYFVGEDRIGYETSSRFLSVRYRCEIDICSYKLREDGNTILIDAFFFFFFDYFFREEWKESNLKGINNNL